MLIKLLKDLVQSPRHQRDDFVGTTGSLPGGNPQACQEFTRALLADFYRLVHARTEDNFDHHRYSYDGRDFSGHFNTDYHVAYLQQFFAHAAEYFATYSLLKDYYSRALFRRLVLYRMLGHLHVQILDGVTCRTETEILAEAAKFDRGPSALAVGGMLGQIRHHEGIGLPDGEEIRLDCWGANIAYTVLKRQYYFSRDGVVIAPEEGDVVLDLGACFGDTAVHFAHAVGPNGHVYAFDPLPSHNQVIDLNIRQNGLEGRITAVPSAIGDAISDPTPAVPGQSFDSVAAPGFSMLGGNPGFRVTTVDAYSEEQRLPSVDFIKMDIEGFELPALIGARSVIERHRPKLAISLYHKPLDLVEIPLWLAQNFPDYDLYIDHYTIHHEETVLYAISRRAS